MGIVPTNCYDSTRYYIGNSTHYYNSDSSSATTVYWASTVSGWEYVSSTSYYIISDIPVGAVINTHEDSETVAKRDKADEKAKLLMQEIFGKEYKILASEGELLVDSEKHHGLKYRISKNPHSKIDIIDARGKVIDRLCIVTSIRCPDWDTILMKIMLAKHDEDRLQEVANHFEM